MFTTVEKIDPGAMDASQLAEFINLAAEGQEPLQYRRRKPGEHCVVVGWFASAVARNGWVYATVNCMVEKDTTVAVKSGPQRGRPQGGR
jgi:hypothetical protein